MPASIEKYVQAFPPHQFRVKRLDQVFFRAQFHGLPQFGEVHRVRHDDHRDGWESLAHFLEYSHTAEHRHIEFNQQAVKWSGSQVSGDTRETRDTIAFRRHFEAEGA